MKYVKGFAILLLLSLAGELLSRYVPFPVPASIYGLVLLFLLLCLRVIKPEQVSDVSDWLIGILPLFFIAPAIGIMESYTLMATMLVTLLVTLPVSTFAVAAITGHVAQFFIRRKP